MFKVRRDGSNEANGTEVHQCRKHTSSLTPTNNISSNIGPGSNGFDEGQVGNRQAQKRHASIAIVPAIDFESSTTLDRVFTFSRALAMGPTSLANEAAICVIMQQCHFTIVANYYNRKRGVTHHCNTS